MSTGKSWESTSAPVEGYIIPPGEGGEHPYFPGARVLAGTASTGGLLGVEEAVLPPDIPGPYRHYHPQLAEAFYVLDGEILLQIGEQVVRAGVGSFAFCPAGCIHAFRAASNTPARVLIIALPPAAGEAYFRELAKLPREAGEAEWDALGKKWGNIVVGPPLESP